MRSGEFLKALLGWLMVFPGVVRNSQSFGPVEIDFQACGPYLRLTIDDGPDPRQTPAILDLLKQRNVRAEFYVIGKKVASHPELCRRMRDEGHAVQNHTYSHPSATFWAAWPNQALSEIGRCSDEIRQATGLSPSRFRAPVGMANPFVHLISRKLGLTLAGWTVSGDDGIRHQPRRVVEKITAALRPGAIILTHDSQLPGMAEGQRACTLEALLDSVEKHGFTFTLDESKPPFRT
jgi:peptidoglycan/xylan/chitin deacetylase (PgdA/CDA1 family)